MGNIIVFRLAVSVEIRNYGRLFIFADYFSG